MSNHLKMSLVQSILHLHSLHWSQRQIAAELDIDRGTVRRHLLRQQQQANAAISPAGSSHPNAATFVGPPAPTEITSAGTACHDSAAEPNTAISPPGSTSTACPPNTTRAGRHNACEPHRDWILTQLDEGQSAQRIWQDLTSQQHFTGGYDSVKRFVRRLRTKPNIPFRRLETAPGEQAQVDFGTGAPIVAADGKRRKTYVFRIVLAHSRKGYSEVTYRQTTDDFIRCLENAFTYFGGVPQTLVIDNLKAAVSHPDWFDPVLVPKLQAFCRHYGTTILPTKPYTPRHKGKIESGIKYVKNNALKGHTFVSLEAQQRHLIHWETHVADKRIHGTTKQQAGKLFAEVERAALLPLRTERFPCFHEAQRIVGRDGHVEVAKAYYSVPPEYLGRTVWARWDARLVHVFNQRWEQIAVHTRRERGRFSTLGPHIHPQKIHGLERGAEYLLRQVAVIGAGAQQWAEAMLTARGIQGTRVLQGLVSLGKKHLRADLEKACETALSYGAYHLKTIRHLLERTGPRQEPLPFLAEHPIIRPLDDYAQVVTQAIRRQEGRSSVSESFARHGWVEERSEAQRRALPSVSGSVPPRSSYPSLGCSSAEPNSVSPDGSSVVPQFPFHQEKA